MGDRGNIVVRQSSGTNSDDVWLYTHWSGYELPQILHRALKRGKPRWTDATYLARIIFSEMIKDDVAGETGYGIGCQLVDNEHEILVVDVPNSRVFVAAETELKDGRIPSSPEILTQFTFSEFCALKDNQLPEI